MPSHYTHMIFGSEAARSAGYPVKHRRWFYLGCQGPDLFLHNQRRKPGSVFWGRSLHRQGYGEFCIRMEQRLAGLSLGWDSPEGCYLAGFITHALLDRAAHPYIHAFSDPGNGRGGKFHPFFERLLDVEITCRFWGCHPWECSCLELMDLGDEPPEGLTALLAEAAAGQFPPSRTEHAPLQVKNAYQDTLSLLKLTGAWSRQAAQQAARSPRREYLLALFHPPVVPREADVLNLARAPWRDPWEEGRISRESFLDLFVPAIESAGAVLQKLTELPPAAEGRSRAAAGAGNLNGSHAHRRASRPAASPLPLEELFTDAAAALTEDGSAVFSCKPR